MPAEVWAKVTVGVTALTSCPTEVVLSMPTCPNNATGAISNASHRKSQELPPNLSLRGTNRLDCSTLRQIGRRRTTREPQHLARAANTRTRALIPQSWTICTRPEASSSSLATTFPRSWGEDRAPSISTPASPRVRKTSRPRSTNTSRWARKPRPSANSTMSPLRNFSITTGRTWSKSPSRIAGAMLLPHARNRNPSPSDSNAWLRSPKSCE